MLKIYHISVKYMNKNSIEIASIGGIKKASANCGQRQDLIHVLLLIAAGVVWFIPRIWPEPQFVTDDYYNLYLLQKHGVFLPWFGLEHMNWIAMRPIASASLYLDILLYGVRPDGYYITNIALHLLSVVAFYYLLEHIHKLIYGATNTRVSLAYALVLLVHSDVFYNVLWVCNRTESMSLVMNLVFCVFALRYYTAPGRVNVSAMIFVLALSLAIKAHAVTLPFLFFALAGIMKSLNLTEVRWRDATFVFGALLLLVLLYFGVWSANEKMTQWTGEMVFTKVYSLFALLLLMVHPELVYQGYNFMYQHKLLLLVLLLCSLALAIIALVKMSSLTRTRVLWTVALLASILLPRTLHLVMERINSFPQAIFLLIVAIALLRYRTWLSLAAGGLLLVSHLIASHVYIEEWTRNTSNDRYRNMLEEARRHESETAVVLLNSGLFEPYAFHFIRTGKFGFDTVLQYSDLMVIRKPFTRTDSGYKVEKMSDGIRFVSTHPRVGFSIDRRINNSAGLRLRTKDALPGHGFRVAEVEVSDSDDRSFYIDSCGVYVRIK